MKLAVVHGPGNLFLQETPRPRPGTDDVVIRVAATGVCGTDLGRRSMGGLTRASTDPLALGHEFAGEIIEAGAAVSSFKVGDRVAYNSANSPADVGRGAAEGGFSPYLLIRNIDAHPQTLVRVPPTLALEHAALVEPLAAGAHAVTRANPQPGEGVALFGAGPVGLGVVLALRWRGIDDIVVFDPSAKRRQMAMAFGAQAAIDPRETPPAEALADLRGKPIAPMWNRGFPRTEVIIEASGAHGVLADIVTWANVRSRIVVVATHEDPVTFDCNMMMGKELTLVGSVGYPDEFPQVMAKLAEGAVDPELLISHRFPLEQIVPAFDQAQDSATALKVLVQFDQE